jgi:hypothetical protein
MTWGAFDLDGVGVLKSLALPAEYWLGRVFGRR